MPRLNEPLSQLSSEEQKIVKLHEQLEGRGNPAEQGLSDKPPFSKDQIVLVNNKPAYYINEKIVRDTIPNNNTDPWIAVKEYGALMYFEAHFDRNQVGLFVNFEGRNKSKVVLNDLLVIDMIRLGRGLTPGEITILPDGTSRDPAGTPDEFVPWVARAKRTIESDAISDTGQAFVIRYTPRYPIEYKSLNMTFRNKSGSPSLLLRAEVVRAQFLDASELTHYGYDRL